MTLFDVESIWINVVEPDLNVGRKNQECNFTIIFNN